MTSVYSLMHVLRMLVELNPAHYTIGIMFLGRSTPTSVRPRYLSKRKTNPIQSNQIKSSGKASNASAVAKTIMLMPIAVREPRNSQTIRTDPISVLRPIVGWRKSSEPEIGFPISKNFNRWWIRLDSRLVRLHQRSSRSNLLRTGRANVRT